MSKEGFFDFRERVGRKREGATVPASTSDGPLTVSQLTALIGRAIKSGVPGSVLVKGEVSNFKHHRASGHFYFTLKDASACIDCVMFKSDAARMKFTPEDGQELSAGGRVDIYPARGRYQLYVTTLQPIGRGALEIAFRQLYEKLHKAGLFDPSRKRPLPAYPMRIALVTSRGGAALQDMLKVLRRFPWLRLGLYHVSVQGDGAAEEIASAIHHLSRAGVRRGYELIILARGGGSLEDLWEFNEEIVARAVVSSAIPVVTGIGHEVDTSIADLVADYHAHTPTEAAAVVTRHWRDAPPLLGQLAHRMLRGLRTTVDSARQQLNSIARHEVFRRPMHRIDVMRQLLDERQRALVIGLSRVLRRDTARLERASARVLECHPQHKIELQQARVNMLAGQLRSAAARDVERRSLRLGACSSQLESLAPHRVLGRGYSITTARKSGAIVRSAADLRAGDRLVTRLADGSVDSIVEDSNQPRLFE